MRKGQKIFDEQKRLIVEAYVRGETTRSIAERFRTTSGNVSTIAKRAGCELRSFRENGPEHVKMILCSDERLGILRGYELRDMDLTASLMGDPPVGYSALDRKYKGKTDVHGS